MRSRMQTIGQSCAAALVAASALAIVVLAPLTSPAAAGKGLTIEEVTSPGGIKAWLVRDSSRPIIAMRVLFRGGSHLDPPGREGLASLTAWMLTEGAGDMDIEAFNRELEEDAIELEFSASDLALTGDLRTLTENREKAFRLLGLALTKPRFDQDSIDIAKEQLVTAIRSDAESPAAVAERRWYANVFPRQPYGMQTSGTEKSVDAVVRKDMVRYARERFAKDRLVVGVVGDVTAGELGRLLDIAFAGLPEKAKPVNLQPAVPAFRRAITVIEKDATQSSVYFGGPGPLRGDLDFPSALVMIQILGRGTFTSRLFHEVRGTRGLAYSIYANLSFSDRVGLITGEVGTANESVARSIDIIRKEFVKIVTSGVTARELADAKQYLTGSFWVPYSETTKIAARLGWVQYHNFDRDYFAKRNQRIEAVTLADVQAAAKKYLDPEKLYFVVVGKPKGLKSE